MVITTKNIQNFGFNNGFKAVLYRNAHITIITSPAENHQAIPVSYTHLDVYKRQDPNMISLPARVGSRCKRWQSTFQSARRDPSESYCDRQGCLRLRGRLRRDHCQTASRQVRTMRSHVVSSGCLLYTSRCV